MFIFTQCVMKLPYFSIFIWVWISFYVRSDPGLFIPLVRYKNLHSSFVPPFCCFSEIVFMCSTWPQRWHDPPVSTLQVLWLWSVPSHQGYTSFLRFRQICLFPTTSLVVDTWRIWNIYSLNNQIMYLTSDTSWLMNLDKFWPWKMSYFSTCHGDPISQSGFQD